MAGALLIRGALDPANVHRAEPPRRHEIFVRDRAGSTGLSVFLMLIRGHLLSRVGLSTRLTPRNRVAVPPFATVALSKGPM